MILFLKSVTLGAGLSSSVKIFQHLVAVNVNELLPSFVVLTQGWYNLFIPLSRWALHLKASKDLIYAGVKEWSALQTIISMSCILVCKVVILALLSRIPYVLLLSSEIRCKACLFSNSSFFTFLTTQKCHTLLQYGKYGKMKALYNLVLVLLDTIFLKHLITLRWLLTGLQILETC